MMSAYSSGRARSQSVNRCVSDVDGWTSVLAAQRE
jgi:hypothetical protein